MIFSNIVGSFLEGKGVDTYLKAIEKINCLECEFDLVGKEGVDKKYNKLINELITDRVVAKGFIDDMLSYYKKIDVVVLTSRTQDALPTVLIEALSQGKILIATNVGGVSEIVDDSFGNIIIPSNNDKLLQQAILEVVSYSQEKIELIKKKNIEIARKKFSLDRQIERIENIYYEVLK